jgi:Holliday junction resolvase RusA-like endonuclease
MAQKPVLIESGPVSLVLVCSMPRPKYIKKDAIWHTKKPDIDNLAKAVMDALNGIVWKDDSQICELSAVKIYDVTPGIQLEVTEL